VKTETKTRTPVSLPPADLDLAPFFHTDCHHELGRELFQLTAIICYQEERKKGPLSEYAASRYIVLAEHTRSGAWFRHDQGSVSPIDVFEAIQSTEVLSTSVAVFYRRHDPRSAHVEDHGPPTQIDLSSPEGKYRIDAPVCALQVEQPLPPLLKMSAPATKHSRSQAISLAGACAKALKARNKDAEKKRLKLIKAIEKELSKSIKDKAKALECLLKPQVDRRKPSKRAKTNSPVLPFLPPAVPVHPRAEPPPPPEQTPPLPDLDPRRVDCPTVQDPPLPCRQRFLDVRGAQLNIRGMKLVKETRKNDEHEDGGERQQQRATSGFPPPGRAQAKVGGWSGPSGKTRI